MVAKTLTPVEYKAIHEFLESQAGIRPRGRQGIPGRQPPRPPVADLRV